MEEKFIGTIYYRGVFLRHLVKPAPFRRLFPVGITKTGKELVEVVDYFPPDSQVKRPVKLERPVRKRL